MLVMKGFERKVENLHEIQEFCEKMITKIFV